MDDRQFNSFIILFCTLGMGICLILMSCFTTPDVQPVCRHEALFAALAWGDLRDDKVRIAIGKTGRTIRDSGKPEWHAQAQAFVNGKWEWLDVNCTVVSIGEKDRFAPSRYMTAAEFAMWLINGNPNLR